MTRPPRAPRPSTTVATEPVADCRVFRVDRVWRRRASTGEVHDWYRIDAAPWVNVVPVTPEGEVVLVRQERHGVGEETLEIPGGVVDPGEDPAAAAVRELREETGYAPGRLEPLGWVHPNPALFSNRCWTYLVRDAVRVGPPAPEGREEIEVVTVPLASLDDLVRGGRITHALVVCAFYWLRDAL